MVSVGSWLALPNAEEWKFTISWIETLSCCYVDCRWQETEFRNAFIFQSNKRVKNIGACFIQSIPGTRNLWISLRILEVAQHVKLESSVCASRRYGKSMKALFAVGLHHGSSARCRCQCDSMNYRNPESIKSEHFSHFAWLKVETAQCWTPFRICRWLYSLSHVHCCFDNDLFINQKDQCDDCQQ